MVDFSEAEKVGMGIRLTLPSAIAAAGLDFLLVLGIRDDRSASTEGAALLADLLDAHHYMDGLSFVPQGTPTNNTEDLPSGFSSKDPSREASYAAQFSAPAFSRGDGSNADVLATALRLSNYASSLAGLPRATEKEQLDARHMNRALWPATWGYFLSQMMCAVQPSQPTLAAEDIAWARQHFIDYVRASGPLPALRIGKQPYGILPVTSLYAWKPRAGQETQQTGDMALKNFLVKLRDLWRGNVAQIPRIGKSDNPSQDFADILSLDGVSSGYAIRHLFGELYLRNLWSFLRPGDQKYWWIKAQAMTKASLDAVGLNWDPRLCHAVYSGWYTQLGGPVIQNDPVTEDAPLEPNYIELLLNEPDFQKIRDGSFGEPHPRGLQYQVLRHAMLLEYRNAALNLLYPQKSDRQSLGYWLEVQEKELIGTPGFGGLSTFQSTWELFDRSAPGVTGRVGDFLHSLRSAPGPDLAQHVAELLEFRESMAHLQTLGTAKLQRLFAGTLDLCSHRLDAWITSIASKRLAEMARADPTGVLVGGYGWVMNLKPAAALTPVQPASGVEGSIFPSPDNPGFVHTPSLTQAATVAVLRSGHLSHAGNGNPGDLLSIDLSSERVRLATWLLDGVRQGQPLGALLGYRFERRLQEAGKASFISSFREVAPLVARRLEQSNEPVVAIAANNVVDGLELKRRWLAVLHLPPPPGTAGALSLLFAPITDKPPQPELLNAGAVLEAELNSLADAVDAVSDALMAESVYQVVRGNPLRAAGTVESIAGGETPPPELDVVRTPRTGVAFTHRVLVLFGGDPALPSGWAPSLHSSRADAEPHLNVWAARLLGNPTKVRCVVERFEPDTGVVLEEKEIQLAQLSLAPLDLIYAVEGGQAGQQAEIEQRIFYATMRRPDGFSPGSMLRINPGRKPGWEIDELSYGEFNELLRTVRKLLIGGRGIDAGDLNPPDRNVDFSVDVVELRKRADGAEQALRRIGNDLSVLLTGQDTIKLDRLRDSVIASAGFGVAGAVPLSAAGDLLSDRDALLSQAGSIQKELVVRVAQLEALAANFDISIATEEEKRNNALARLHAVFGQAFVVLPRFTAANAAELEQALADSEKVQDGDPLVSTTWLLRTSRVRSGIARLNQALSYAEAIGSGERLKLKIA
jgi:hypothetical protein